MKAPRRFIELTGAESGKPFIVDADAIVSVGAWGRDNNMAIVMYEVADKCGYVLASEHPADIIADLREENA